MFLFLIFQVISILGQLEPFMRLIESNKTLFKIGKYVNRNKCSHFLGNHRALGCSTALTGTTFCGPLKMFDSRKFPQKSRTRTTFQNSHELT